LYLVNWQRRISIEYLRGRKVVVKKNKPTKVFHEYLLIFTYTLASILLAHPSAPPHLGKVMLQNESHDMRRILQKLGIPTPELISISDSVIIEEYIKQGDLYRAFSDGKNSTLAFQAGALTGKLHKANYVFTDNKSQNYLVASDMMSLIRTDLGFIQKKGSIFSRSIDIGSFLASVIDFENSQYQAIERAFFYGYKSETKHSFPYLSIILRNLLSFGFASNHTAMFRNMVRDSSKTL
jgi:tRNA A-37 threonylcarbamoyl transferase component Bud32